MKKQYEHLIVNGIRWVDSLPDHEGSVGGKGFPILMNGGLVPEANAWVCPTMFQITKREADIVAKGTGAKANPHIHDGDEMYLILGDKGAVMFRITLGCDVYHLESQCAVYIPAGLPHAIEAERFTEGAYGGSCQIYLDKNYVTKPVPDEPLKADDRESLIVRDIQWVESLPDHEGSVGGKGFPILMNGSLVPQANAWLCPTLFLATQRQVRIVEAGTGPKANPHIHDGDEMYLILGAPGMVEFEITLGEDGYHLKSPCAVYIPAGVPHSIRASKFTEGAYDGSCQIYLDRDYVTRPVPVKGHS